MNEWVLVTGGTGGIGSALVKGLAQAGFRPAIGYRSNREAAETLAKEYGGEAVALDLSRGDQIEAATAHLAGRDVAALVLNASPPPVIERFRELAASHFEEQFQISVIGNYRLLACMIGDVFRRKKRGMVIGVLTRAMGTETDDPLKYVTPYNVANYGLLGLLRCAKAEYRWLRIETVYPDFTDTPMLSAFDPRFVEMLRDQNKIAQPIDVAREIVDHIAAMN